MGQHVIQFVVYVILQTMAVHWKKLKIDYAHILGEHANGYPIGSQFFGSSELQIAVLVLETVSGWDERFDRANERGSTWFFTKTFPFHTGFNYLRGMPCHRVRVLYEPSTHTITTAYPYV